MLQAQWAGYWCAWLLCGRIGLFVSFRAFGIWIVSVIVGVYCVFEGRVIGDDVPSIYDVATKWRNVLKGMGDNHIVLLCYLKSAYLLRRSTFPC